MRMASAALGRLHSLSLSAAFEKFTRQVRHAHQMDAFGLRVSAFCSRVSRRLAARASAASTLRLFARNAAAMNRGVRHRREEAHKAELKAANELRRKQERAAAKALKATLKATLDAPTEQSAAHLEASRVFEQQRALELAELAERSQAIDAVESPRERAALRFQGAWRFMLCHRPAS